jgi:iron complex outermembrane receptor protein
MKKMYVLGYCLMVASLGSWAQSDFKLGDSSYLQPVEVNAVRASDKTPIAKTNLSRKEIEKRNNGQDLPFLLQFTPSVVVNSDAGNGIGYTGIRIRGTDASRINITLNGIPYNDAESQGTFLVNIPDFVSSTGSIQVQRGVGTSTNGAGAFGGSINLSTNEVKTKRSLELNNTVGSFNSWKNTLLFNSGIFANHFTFDARLSSIRSDGYVDRATSNLRAFYSSLAYVDENNSLRLNVFSGKEKTYQSWYGVDEATLQTNRTANSAGTEKPGAPYDNETDNYGQTHYQLFYNRKINRQWKVNAALFYTKGKGYYEQYKAGASLSDYQLPNLVTPDSTYSETDLVRRLWLDNDFYGGIFSLQYEQAKRQFIIGGGLNAYDGDHFGQIIWADVAAAVPNKYRWYDNNAFKTDASLYTKYTEKLGKNWQSFVDLQVRRVGYEINGFRNNPGLKVDNNYTFFNPKAGFTYTHKNTQAYLSYARANKEPNRDDFEAGMLEQPLPETLNDFELGFEQKNKSFTWSANVYYMLYRNQLVLTGKVNDVGAYTRTNIRNSYRLGTELQTAFVVNKWLNVGANATLSNNKVKNFTEFIDDYDNGGQQTKLYNNADIAFSPSVMGALLINIIPAKKWELNLEGKYVGKQYLDNTSQDSRSLDAFYTQHARIAYNSNFKNIKAMNLFLQVNNIFSKRYEPNGYTFSYIAGGSQITENYYFPMAPINLTFGLNIRL